MIEAQIQHNSSANYWFFGCKMCEWACANTSPREMSSVVTNHLVSGHLVLLSKINVSFYTESGAELDDIPDEPFPAVVGRWADIENIADQMESVIGMKLAAWQRDWIQHISKGERLVRTRTRGHHYHWAKENQNDADGS